MSVKALTESYDFKNISKERRIHFMRMMGIITAVFVFTFLYKLILKFEY